MTNNKSLTMLINKNIFQMNTTWKETYYICLLNKLVISLYLYYVFSLWKKSKAKWLLSLDSQKKVVVFPKKFNNYFK